MLFPILLLITNLLILVVCSDYSYYLKSLQLTPSSQIFISHGVEHDFIYPDIKVVKLNQNYFISIWTEKGLGGDLPSAYGQIFQINSTMSVGQKFPLSSCTLGNVMQQSKSVISIDDEKFLIVWNDKQQYGVDNLWGKFWEIDQDGIVSNLTNDFKINYLENFYSNTVSLLQLDQQNILAFYSYYNILNVYALGIIDSQNMQMVEEVIINDTFISYDYTIQAIFLGNRKFAINAKEETRVLRLDENNDLETISDVVSIASISSMPYLNKVNNNDFALVWNSVGGGAALKIQIFNNNGITKGSEISFPSGITCSNVFNLFEDVLLIQEEETLTGIIINSTGYVLQEQFEIDPVDILYSDYTMLNDDTLIALYINDHACQFLNATVIDVYFEYEIIGCAFENYNISTGCSKCNDGWKIEEDCEVCLGNYNISTGCSECNDGWSIDEDCEVCLDNYNISTGCSECNDGWSIEEGCEVCLDNYNISTGCSSCMGNWDIEKDCLECLSNYDIKFDCSKIKEKDEDLIFGLFTIYEVIVALSIVLIVIIFLLFLIFLIFCCRCRRKRQRRRMIHRNEKDEIKDMLIDLS